MTWFERLTGFRETSPEEVRRRIRVEGPRMTSLANGRVMTCGTLETPSLADLRRRAEAVAHFPGRLRLHEVVADVRALHQAPANAGALFQVASQFNLLEMVGPSVTPEQGVGRYENDNTQGPACAVAAGAGTIYRNYFVPLPEGPGQTEKHQIDCLADLGEALGNTDQQLWTMRNGYVLATREGLEAITERLAGMSEAKRDALRGRLRVGIQWHTQVTLGGCTHTVTQVYTSALPVAYSREPSTLWEPFARLVLEAAYEATLCAAVLNAAETGNPRTYLTLLGGGAFGNDQRWIADGLVRALRRYADHSLDVAIVSFGGSHPTARRVIRIFERRTGDGPLQKAHGSS